MTRPTAQLRTKRADEYAALTTEHGGYWRHDFTDHAYLYNLYYPPAPVFEVFRERIHELVLNYPAAQDVMAGLVGELIGQPAERLVVGNGAAEIIKIISGTLAKKLIVPVPSFNEYANAAPEGVVVEFPLHGPEFALDVDAFAAEAIRVGADYAVVVSPNNPTSAIVPRTGLLRLLAQLEDNGCTLVVDESFIDFSDAGYSQSLERDVKQHRNLAVIKSMSKAYGICGLRLGYLLTSKRALARRVREGLHIWNINGFAEEFLRMAPEFRQDFVESCERVRTDRDTFYERLRDIPGLKVVRPSANFIMCRLPDDGPSGPEIERALFVEHNIYVKHCAEKTMPEGDRYLRIAVRTPAENAVLVDALAQTLGVLVAR